MSADEHTIREALVKHTLVLGGRPVTERHDEDCSRCQAEAALDRLASARDALGEFADGNRTDSRGRDFARAALRGARP